MKPNYWVSKSSLSLHDSSDDWKNIVSIESLNLNMENIQDIKSSHSFLIFTYYSYSFYHFYSSCAIVFYVFYPAECLFLDATRTLFTPESISVSSQLPGRKRVNRQQRGKKLRVIYLSVSSQEINFSLLLSFSTQRSEMSNNDRQTLSLSG